MYVHVYMICMCMHVYVLDSLSLLSEQALSLKLSMSQKHMYSGHNILNLAWLTYCDFISCTDIGYITINYARMQGSMTQLQ